MKKRTILLSALLAATTVVPIFSQTSKEEVLDIIYQVNDRWQRTHAEHKKAFWDYAAYHTGNMEAYFLTGKEAYLKYSEEWAEHCEWKGAKSDDKSKWKYKNYGEGEEYVLFGDWQACFQTYIDLYNIKPEDKRIARTREVMEYQISTSAVDYLWWVDGLYMVMPVMSKLYKVTKDELLLERLHAYWRYANSIMWDGKEGLYFRDKNFIYPAHKTPNGKKDFWSRGNGWAFAALAKVLQDVPADHIYRNVYSDYFTKMANAVIACQQPEGYWSRSLLDSEHAPGYETSGSAFFTYGLFWGINNGYLDKEKFLPYALKGWKYLSEIALQDDGRVGYIQPIGASADPNQVVDVKSSWNFGIGAYLLAACETYRYFNTPASALPHKPVSKNIICYNKESRSLKISLDQEMVNQNIKISLFDLNGTMIWCAYTCGKSIVDMPLHDLPANGLFIANLSSTNQEIQLNENTKILIH